MTPEAEQVMLIRAAAVDVITGAVEREEAAFAEGYRLGYGTGYDVGYAHAENDMAKDWAVLAREVLADGNAPRLDELARRRFPPDGDRERWIRQGDSGRQGAA